MVYSRRLSKSVPTSFSLDPRIPISFRCPRCFKSSNSRRARTLGNTRTIIAVGEFPDEPLIQAEIPASPRSSEKKVPTLPGRNVITLFLLLSWLKVKEKFPFLHPELRWELLPGAKPYKSGACVPNPQDDDVRYPDAHDPIISTVNLYLAGSRGKEVSQDSKGENHSIIGDNDLQGSLVPKAHRSL